MARGGGCCWDLHVGWLLGMAGAGGHGLTVGCCWRCGGLAGLLVPLTFVIA